MMTLPNPAPRPCPNPARPCLDPSLTLLVTLAGLRKRGLACDFGFSGSRDPADPVDTGERPMRFAASMSWSGVAPRFRADFQAFSAFRRST